MQLVLIRGLPGSGKTTLARLMGKPFFEADQFFEMEDNGGYEFDAKLLPEAHKWCHEQTKRCLEAAASVVVSNTFSQLWEMQPYLALSEQLLVFDLFDNGLTDEQLAERTVHSVPLETMARMRKRWEKWDGLASR